MLSPTVRRVVCWAAAVTLGGLPAGCGGQPAGKPASEAKVHILKAATLAMQYRGKNKRYPTSAEELKTWAKALKPEELKQIGIDNLDEALTSPRDKQPYQFAKPKDPRAQQGMMSVLVYEKVGADGQHLTASSMGSFGRATSDELKKIDPDFGK
jgi:hypothetical protein